MGHFSPQLNLLLLKEFVSGILPHWWTTACKVNKQRALEFDFCPYKKARATGNVALTYLNLEEGN